MGALATKSYEQDNADRAKNQADFSRIDGGCAEIADNGGDDHRRHGVGDLCLHMIEMITSGGNRRQDRCVADR